MIVLQALITTVVMFIVCVGIPLALTLLGFYITFSTIDKAKRRKARRSMSPQERTAEEEVFQLEKMLARS